MSHAEGGDHEAALSCRPEIAGKVDAVFDAYPDTEAALQEVRELSEDEVSDAYFRLAERALERQLQSKDGSQPQSELVAESLIQRVLYESLTRSIGAVATEDQVGALKRQILAHFDYKVRWW